MKNKNIRTLFTRSYNRITPAAPLPANQGQPTIDPIRWAMRQELIRRRHALAKKRKQVKLTTTPEKWQKRQEQLKLAQLA